MTRTFEAPLIPVQPVDKIVDTARTDLKDRMEKEKIQAGTLVEFDVAYFEDLKERDPKLRTNIDPNDKKYRYFTVKSTNGGNIGIIGIYNTEKDVNLTDTIVDPDYRGQGLTKECKDLLMQTLNLPFLTLTIDYDPYKPAHTGFSNVSSMRAAEKLPGVERVVDPFHTKLGKAKFIYRRTPEEDNSNVLITKKLIAIREKIESKEFDSIDSHQFVEEINIPLHQIKDNDLILQVLGAPTLKKYFNALSQHRVYHFVLPLGSIDIPAYLEYAFSSHPAQHVIDSIKKEPISDVTVNIFISHCLSATSFVFAVLEEFPEQELSLLLRQMIEHYPPAEKTLSGIFNSQRLDYLKQLEAHKQGSEGYIEIAHKLNQHEKTLFKV